MSARRSREAWQRAYRSGLWREGSGAYGRNCTDDATLDAALLTQDIGRPVRVQIMREEEHGWEPKGAAHLIDISGGVDEKGKIVAYDVMTKFMVSPLARLYSH